MYKYTPDDQKWNIFKNGSQAKQVRFDRLGKMYFLGVDNCTYSEQNVKLVCGVSDFEVTVDGKIIAQSDGTATAGNGVYSTDPQSGIQYTRYDNITGLTLIKDTPVFIGNDNKAPSEYNLQVVKSISAGIDGSLWALEYKENVTDYPVLKWQDITKKWYRVEGAAGINIAAYNEISLAIVDSAGLVKLSSP